ncbi:MAG TPA: O-antigen ligase family protein [Puia sp.]|nr:O-antigen ligase family protein [Puia sp.]
MLTVAGKRKNELLQSPQEKKGWIWVTFGLAVVLGIALAKNLMVGVGLFSCLVGLAVVLVCILNAEAGLYINIVYSFFSFGASRLFFNDTFPVGVVSNVLIIGTFLGIFIKKGSNGRAIFSQFSRTAIARSILAIFFYIMLELFNPLAHSFDGWYAAIRALAMTIMLLFAAYAVFDNWRSMRRFIIVVFIFVVIVAIYGCIQQWHGLFDFEKDWVAADPVRFGLIFIAGDYRKFSTMSDPAGFAIVMACCSVFFLVLLTGPWRRRLKFLLFTAVCFLLMSMAYSGTRTANAMVLGGIVFFMLLTINKRSTIIFSAVTVVVFLVLLFGPFSSNPTINRFRTTFTGNQDESYKVRNINRRSIQPYIYYHPIGGGLGTTGAYGAATNPGHFLAGFPTDSGYLKKALEVGWIGLFLIVTLYYCVVRAGIRGYFQCRNEKAKNIYAAATCCMFSFYVAEYAQDAVGQITDIVVYYPMIALILRLKNFEHEIT